MRCHRADGRGTFADTAVVAVDADLPPEQLALVVGAVTTGVGAALNTAGVRPGDVVAVIVAVDPGATHVMSDVPTTASPTATLARRGAAGRRPARSASSETPPPGVANPSASGSGPTPPKPR